MSVVLGRQKARGQLHCKWTEVERKQREVRLEVDTRLSVYIRKRKRLRHGQRKSEEPRKWRLKNRLIV